MIVWLYCTLLWAQEGFWKSDDIPPKLEWSIILPKLTNHASILLSSVVQLPNCTGAIISKSGLIITNAHCIQSYVQKIDTTFHAQKKTEERPIPNFFVHSTVAVSDVHKQIYRGISKNALPDYTKYRTERNKRVLLRSCHAESSRYKCHIHFDTTTQRYQLVQKEKYDDVRLVHQSSSKTSDIALIRIYKHGKPLVTPQHLKAKKEEPKSLSSIAIIGYPIHSHRYPLPIEWDLIQDFTKQTLLYTKRSKKIINASKAPNIHPLRDIIIEIEQNATVFRNQYQETSPKTLRNKAYSEFIGWIQKEPNGKKWIDAIQEYEHILKKKHDIELKLLELKWLSLSSELLFSARRRYGWRENRKIPDEQRIKGYRDQDKESLLLHIRHLSKKWHEDTESQLLAQMLNTSSLPAIKTFVKRYPSVDDAIFDLYKHTEPLLSIKEGLLHLNTRHPLPSNPWFSLGSALEQLYFDLLLSKKEYEKLQKKAHAVYMRGMKGRIKSIQRS